MQSKLIFVPLSRCSHRAVKINMMQEKQFSVEERKRCSDRALTLHKNGSGSCEITQ